MHNILKRIIFPLKFDKDKTFNLNVEDYDFLRYWMSRFTYEDIGDKFGLTRERVRQIKDKAINKLRSVSRSKLLKNYLKLPKNQIKILEDIL